MTTEPTETSASRLAPTVAVLIMVVSLMASVFAYLDSQAGNRAAMSQRRAEASGVSGLEEAGITEGEIGQQVSVYKYANDAGWIAVGLDGSAPGSDLTAGLADTFDAIREQAASFSVLIGGEYQLPDGTIALARYVEESRRPAYRAVEMQRAHSAVSGEWSAKSGKYIAIITMLAAALFLLGLTVSVVRESQSTLVLSGVALAAVAGVWGLAVWLSPVPEVSERAIDAYIDGAIRTYISSDPVDMRFAERRFGDAIEADPSYREAYLGRSYALFLLDLADPAGPQGSPEAVANLEAALRLDDQDALAWNNLGAALFWLDRYDDAGAAWERALRFDPDEPILNINQALLLAVNGDPGYDAQLEVVRNLLVGLPTWQRTAVVGSILEALQLSETYRPAISREADSLHATLFHMDREIAVGRRFFGTPEPVPVAATISPPEFTLSADGTVLRVDFTYTGVEVGQRFIYRTLLDGVESETLSLPQAEAWILEVPDGNAFVEITLPAGFAGHTVRVELYFEGNLLAVGEFSS